MGEEGAWLGGEPSPPRTPGLPRGGRFLAEPLVRAGRKGVGWGCRFPTGAVPSQAAAGGKGDGTGRRLGPSPSKRLPLPRRRLTGGGIRREAAAPRQWGVRERAWPSPEAVSPPLPPPDKGGYPSGSGRAAAIGGLGGNLVPPDQFLPLSRGGARGGWGVRAVPARPAARCGCRDLSDTYPCQPPPRERRLGCAGGLDVPGRVKLGVKAILVCPAGRRGNRQCCDAFRCQPSWRQLGNRGSGKGSTPPPRLPDCRGAAGMRRRRHRAAAPGRERWRPVPGPGRRQWALLRATLPGARFPGRWPARGRRPRAAPA